ncbi:MAG: NACHT domain-containing protein, partial [Actinobacteria bacterium]|nr:NACHT domain-containing protein [Actinomycetota bacterium]
MLIEVKDHPGASTPIQEVRDFANTASIALSQGHGTSAFFVTTGALTRDSGAVVAGLPNVNLIEFADLERQLFDPTGALQRWQLAYKSKPVNHRYVDLQATLFDISSNELGDFPGHVPATGLLGLATSSPSACVVIFGDYGSGKTTILQRLFSAAIEQTSIHRDAPFPVLLRLREFEQPYDIGDFVLRALRRDLGISDLASSLLWEFVEAGRLIFMFDGFDEITLRADDAVRADLMARLSPLLFSPCPALLTTRPGYFASWEEYRGLIRRSAGSSAVARASDPGSQRVDDLIERLTARFVDASPTTARAAQVIEYQLDPLTSDQVDEYLESARDELGETEPQEVRAFLDKVYDLSELITRPIILEMAVGTIAEGKIDVSKGTLANGAAGLYEAYARTHLNRDVANVPSRRDVLSPDDRLRFAEECASEMLRLDVLELAPETSRRLAQRILGESNEYNIDEALTDLRTCSFLTISVD